MKIALLGYGTVGSGAHVAAGYTENIEVKTVLELRDVPEISDIRTEDFDSVMADPEIALVAECIGGKTIAKDMIIKAMNAGKHVVTPNKALMSECYDELMAIASENNVELRFTPAAGGGIPWLYNLSRTKRCDSIQEVHGIVNGTCNYILDKMHTEGSDFDEVLKEAQSMGYAEKDPTADIKAIDTLRKCVLSANMAFNCRIKEADIPTFGIDTITASDIDYFNENGYTCRLLMNSGIIDGRLYAYVEPMLFRPGALETGVGTNFNLITLTADNVGTLSFYGQGAGKLPTGQNVIQDAIDIDVKIGFKENDDIVDLKVDNSIITQRYYMRTGDEVVITEPMTIAAAHDIAADKQTSGAAFFMAGIKE